MFAQNKNPVSEDNLQITGIMVTVRERKPPLNIGVEDDSTQKELIAKEREWNNSDESHLSSGFVACKENKSSVEAGIEKTEHAAERETHATLNEDQTTVSITNHPEKVHETSTPKIRNNNVSENFNEKKANIQPESFSINIGPQRETLQEPLIEKGIPPTVTVPAKNKGLAETQTILRKQELIARENVEHTNTVPKENSTTSTKKDKLESKTGQENSHKRKSPDTNETFMAKVVNTTINSMNETNRADAETPKNQDAQLPVKEDITRVTEASKSRNIDGKGAPLLEQKRHDSPPGKLFNKSPSNQCTDKDNTHVSPDKETNTGEKNQLDDDVHIDSIAIRVVPAVTGKENQKTAGKDFITPVTSDAVTADQYKQSHTTSPNEKANTLNNQVQIKDETPACTKKHLQESLEDKFGVQYVLSNVRKLSDLLKISSQQNNTNASNTQAEDKKSEKVKKSGTSVVESGIETMEQDYFQVQGSKETNNEADNSVNVADGILMGEEVPGSLRNKAAISNEPFKDEKHEVLDQSKRKTVELIKSDDSENTKGKNSETEDKWPSKQSDGPTGGTSNNEKLEAARANHTRKHPTESPSSLSTRERQRSRNSYSTKESVEIEKPDVKPKERVSTIPEISALADYARLKVIVSEDRANTVQEFAPNKKEGFFPLIQTRHSRRPEFTVDPKDLSVKDKSLLNQGEVSAKVNKEPKALVFPITDKEHQRTGMFKLGDKLLDVKSNEKHTQQQRNKSPTAQTEQVAAAGTQRVSQVDPSIYQSNMQPSQTTCTINKPKGLTYLDKNSHPQPPLRQIPNIGEITARKENKVEKQKDKNTEAQTREGRTDEVKQERFASWQEETNTNQQSKAKHLEEELDSRTDEQKSAENIRIKHIIEESRASLAEEERKSAQREEERRVREREAITIQIKERREKLREIERKAQDEREAKQMEEDRSAQKEVELREKQREEEMRMTEAEEKRRIKTEEEERKAKLKEEKAQVKEREGKSLKQLNLEKAAQEEHQRRSVIEEQQKRAAIEEQWRRAVQEEQQKKAAEEQQRRAAAAEEQQKRAAEEQQRRASIEEQWRRAVQEEQQREAAIEEQQKRAAEEQQRRAAEEQQSRAAEEQQRRAAIEEQWRRAVQEEQQRGAAIEEQQKRAAEERQRRAAIEEQQRKAALEEQQKRAAEEQQRRVAEEQQRRAAIEEQQRRAALEEQQKRAAEQQERRAAIEEQQKRAAEEQQRRTAIEEQQKRAAIEEQQRRTAIEEQQKRAVEEQQRRAAIEEQQRRTAIEEQQRRAAEEQQRRAAEEQQKRRDATEEQQRRALIEENQKRAAEEEQKRRATLVEEQKRDTRNDEKMKHIESGAGQISEEDRIKQIQEQKKTKQKIEEQRRERQWLRTQREAEQTKTEKEVTFTQQREEKQEKTVLAQREDGIIAEKRVEDEKLATHRELEKAPEMEEQKKAAQMMDAIQYYAITSTESEHKTREKQLRSPLPSQKRNNLSGLECTEDSGSHTITYRPQAPVSPASSLPRSNTSSPAQGSKPSMFRVKDNTIRGSSFTKSVKPRFHKNFGADLRMGSPIERGSERRDEEQEVTRRNTATPVHSDTGSNRLATIKESSPFQSVSTSQDFSAPLTQHRPYSRRSAAVDVEDDSRSVISNMSEDVESCATGATDLADIRGLYDYDRPESACSFSSDVSRSLGKPPTVPPKSEKALQRAKRLTSRRIKKELSKVATEHPGGAKKTPQEVSTSPSSSSTEVHSSNHLAAASPHFPPPVSLAHAPTMESSLPSSHTEQRSSHHSVHASPHATGPISLPFVLPHATAPVSVPVAPSHAPTTAPLTAAPKTAAHVPSSPTVHHGNHPAPVTQYHVESSYPQSYPLTQRKVLQDLGSGQYYVVDVPVQVKTKTFFDPETGKYVQLNVRESGQSTSRSQPQQTYTQPHLQPQMQAKPLSQSSTAGKPLVLYQGYHGYPKGYQPINSVTPHRSSATVTVHQDQQPVRETHSNEVGQISEGHYYSPEKTPYMDTVNDKEKTYNRVYSTHGSHESFPECDTNRQLARSSVCENDNSAPSRYRPRDIITMSELEDFMEVSDW
ncbi:hypothetical protein Q5P01_021425 [Channa striata]|uniref:DUF4585 domain-containing protein n=1 Tax=Channa striata TaxID=64152 RepID=A0AA88LUA4_CHASR|nr:hypothetical protein Q5P01_021425 [Channa striata]